MGDKEKLLQQLIEYAGDDYETEQKSLLLTMIDDAIDEVCDVMYPYGFSSDAEHEKVRQTALKRYGSKIRKIAQYHYDKQGKEGVVSWSEGGSSASYESTGTPESYFSRIVPIAKIVR